MWSENEFHDYQNAQNPFLTQYEQPKYGYSTIHDSKRTTSLSTRWVMGVGKTFIYTNTKKGGMLGLSVGFNVVKRKILL